MSDCPKEENLRDADSATLSAARRRGADGGTKPVPFLGEILRMCLAVMKEWNVVCLGSERLAVFFFFPWLRMSCFSCEGFC